MRGREKVRSKRKSKEWKGGGGNSGVWGGVKHLKVFKVILPRCVIQPVNIVQEGVRILQVCLGVVRIFIYLT